ncbi:HAMP domain-containing protein, partial [Christensenellaceae bacterium OttesenSCG-928-K19]|nr:HAMP domain-containing protein [Christensenellaceae bacterium OttesenSCG-928-K19]
MKKSITRRMLVTTISTIVILAVVLVLVMTYFMNSLMDTVMLETLQPMAKTAAESVEGNLHMLADRFFMLRKNNVLSSFDPKSEDVKEELNDIISGIEFVWLGVYHTNGTLFSGSDEAPRSIAGRGMTNLIAQTNNLVIENTSVGTHGLEIAMGLPLMVDSRGGAKTFYLVGSYQYDVLGDVLASINIGANSTAFIIDEAGTVIAHKMQGKVYSQETISDGLGGTEALLETFRLMVQGQSGSTRVDDSAVGEAFISYAPVRGTYWSLGIAAPKSDFVGSLWQAVSTSILFVLIFVVVVGITLVLLFRRMLTAPMQVITERSRQLSAGNLEDTLPEAITGRNDEIGQLGNAFVSFSQTIHGVISEVGILTGDARAGRLNERADLTGYEGDYHSILSGMNETLDVFCEYLEAIPDGVALFNENKEPIYYNEAMERILTKHSEYSDNANLLASIISAGQDSKLPPAAE